MEEESFCLQTKIDNTRTEAEFDCAEIFIKLLKEDQRNMRIQTVNSKSHKLCHYQDQMSKATEILSNLSKLIE